MTPACSSDAGDATESLADSGNNMVINTLNPKAAAITRNKSGLLFTATLFHTILTTHGNALFRTRRHTAPHPR